jgi:hypothetical protein
VSVYKSLRRVVVQSHRPMSMNYRSGVALCICWSALLPCRYNANVFGGQLPANLQITWSKTLCTTAGLTHYSRTAPAQGGGSWKCAEACLSAHGSDWQLPYDVTCAVLSFVTDALTPSTSAQ